MEVRLYYESLVYKTFEKVQKITFIDILGESLSLSLSLHEILCFVSDAFFIIRLPKNRLWRLIFCKNIDLISIA